MIALTEHELLGRERANRFTLICILATVAMLFAAFTGAYLIRQTSVDWSRIALPGLLRATSAILVASSVTLELARRRAGARWFEATMVLGILFLIGQLLAWRELAAAGALDASAPHSAFFATLSAVHGMHVFGGLIALFVARHRPSTFGLVAVYWHFVGVVWLYVYGLLSLA